MTKDLSRLEEQNAGKFNNVNYLHGFRFGVLEGVDEGYLQGRKDAIEEIGDSMTFHQDGLSGYFTISSDEWEKLEEKENESV